MRAQTIQAPVRTVLEDTPIHQEVCCILVAQTQTEETMCFPRNVVLGKPCGYVQGGQLRFK